MKRVILTALFLALFAIPGITQNDCGLFITTNFDSECLLSDFGRDGKPIIDETVCLQAYRGATVKYYAEGMDNADLNNGRVYFLKFIKQ